VARRDIINAATTKDAVLQGLISTHQSRSIRAIRNIERDVMDLLSDAKTKGGLLLSEQVNAQFAVRTQTALTEIFAREYRDGFIRPSLTGYNEAAQGISAYYKTLDLPIVFTDVDIEVIRALKAGSFTQYEVLAARFQQELADQIYKTTLAGGRFADLVDGVRNSLVGIEDMRGVPMAVHSGQLVHDSLMSFDATLNQKKADDLEIENFLYFGSTVKGTRDFCRAYAGETRTREEWNNIGSGDWQGKREGDFFINRGGYQCGHQLVAVPGGA
jgi:hypothetical protein